jgi:hypothetical protein
MDSVVSNYVYLFLLGCLSKPEDTSLTQNLSICREKSFLHGVYFISDISLMSSNI